MNRTEWMKWYSKKYLPSNHWQRTRRRALIRAGWECQIKGCEATNTTLDVHHLSYRHVSKVRLFLCEITGLDIFGEWPRDLKVVCRYHHDLITADKLEPKWKGWSDR